MRTSPLFLILAFAFACSGKDDADTTTDPGDDHSHADTDTDADADADADTDADADADADTDTDTDADAVEIGFQALVGGAPFTCGTTYPTPAGDVTVNDFRFYVSNVALIADDGMEMPLTLADDGVWQGDGVALLDFEDATAGCAVGTADMNQVLVGEVGMAHTWDGIAFDLGVPFELNHQDVALAAPPLNVTAMFWSWQGGYKFLRVDMVNAATAPWHIHLGSTMCVSGSSVEAPTVECDRPNRPRITLRGFDPTATDVVIDLADLLDGADTTLETASTPPGCMSNPMDASECPPVFTNLGLDFSTGACDDDCSGQVAFGGE